MGYVLVSFSCTHQGAVYIPFSHGPSSPLLTASCPTLYHSLTQMTRNLKVLPSQSNSSCSQDSCKRSTVGTRGHSHYWASREHSHHWASRGQRLISRKSVCVYSQSFLGTVDGKNNTTATYTHQTSTGAIMLQGLPASKKDSPVWLCHAETESSLPPVNTMENIPCSHPALLCHRTKAVPPLPAASALVSSLPAAWDPISLLNFMSLVALILTLRSIFSESKVTQIKPEQGPI